MSRLEENFAVKLRRRRMALGYTQKTLANSIGYSEKAVSKWESGRVLPPTYALLRVADALQVSLDDLMDFQEDPSFFLGIDGGATKTDFALADGEGRIISRTLLGSSNPVDIGIEAAMEVLEAGIRHVCRGISLRRISMFAGISGGTSGDNRERLHAFFSGFHFAKFDNGSDAQPIVAAGLQDRDGMVVIMGTGSVVFVQKDGVLHRIGGLGYLFDEGGNGYSLGRDVLRAVMAAEDGSGNPTALSGLFARQTGKSSALACLPEFYELGKRGIAAYAPLAIQAASAGDTVAQDILVRNMRQIARLLDAGWRKLDQPLKAEVVFVGGLTNHETLLMPLIQKELAEKERYRFSVYREPAVNGALLLAGLKKEDGQPC